MPFSGQALFTAIKPLWSFIDIAGVLILAAAPAAGLPAPSPEVSFQCAAMKGGKLQVVGLSPDGLSSCQGEIFARGPALWGHDPAPPKGAAPDAALRRAPETVAGGILELTLEPPRSSSAILPDVFIAPVLRGGGKRPITDRILCEKEAPSGKSPEKGAVAYACAAPAEVLSVRIGLPPLGLSFLWDFQIPEKGTVKETLELPTGVALSGDVSESDVVARLFPRGLGHAEDRIAFASQVTQLPRGGTVRFENVAPGAYVYRLEGRNGTSTHAPLVVPESATEARLPGLSLPRIVTVGVQVTPAEDGKGQPWTLRLIPRRTNENPTKILTTHTDPTGWQSIDGVLAGDYLLFVEDSDGSRWLEEALRVDDNRTLTLDIQRVAVEGTASQGDDPFVGKLIFGGLYGSRTITFTTEDDGHFAGFLPKEGKWEVEISSKDLGCGPCDGTGGSIRIPPVEVHRGPSGKALLDIEIPDTKLAGRVVVEETTPEGETVRRLQPGATVVVVRTSGSAEDRGRQAQVWTDDGKFKIVGLEPGDVRVGAMLADPPYESDWTMVHIEEGDESAKPLEMVLHAKTHLLVKLTSANGPVGGATVTALVTGGKSAWGASRADGTVSLELPAGKAGTLLVEAPGYGMALAPFQTLSGGSAGRTAALAVPLAPASGSLVLSDLPYDVFSEGSLISEDGGTVALRLFPTLAPGVISFGESITISDLAPGTYELCTRRGDCWQGKVFAGGSSELHLSEAK